VLCVPSLCAVGGSQHPSLIACWRSAPYDVEQWRCVARVWLLSTWLAAWLTGASFAGPRASKRARSGHHASDNPTCVYPSESWGTLDECGIQLLQPEGTVLTPCACVMNLLH